MVECRLTEKKIIINIIFTSVGANDLSNLNVVIKNKNKIYPIDSY